ncbi:MAG TPA: ABC transporter permease [Egibacteraceae bacterium]|nr:ABC transporter permease [Egibacteraceae bacterium]
MSRARSTAIAALRSAAPVLAVLFALAVSSLVLLLIGESPVGTFAAMLRYASRLDSIVSILNRAIPLFLAGLAVAAGFRMGLFNIGVEGQYRISALVAAYLGAIVTLPTGVHLVFVALVGAVVGGLWAGVAALLKVYRGVHEVISTIMLNFIATGLAAYLLAEHFREPAVPGDLQIKTAALPASAMMPSLNWLLEGLGLELRRGTHLQGFLLVAVLIGAAFWFLVARTRFGYDLRASGTNPLAAQASGVDQGRMILKVMFLSGALAGLVGVSQLVGFFGRYTIDFPVGLGFAGIAVALLGRNTAVGTALAALLFGFLDRSAQILDLEDVPKEITTIVQGVIILAVVIAGEIARRAARTQEAVAVSQEVAGEPEAAAAGGGRA